MIAERILRGLAGARSFVFGRVGGGAARCIRCTVRRHGFERSRISYI